MPHTNRVGDLTLLLLLAGAALCAVMTEERVCEASVHAAGRQDKRRPVEARLPEIPRVRLAPLPEFDDDAAYVRSIAARVEELAAEAAQVDDLPRRADLLLAAANRILAHQLEPPCTRRLLHVDRPDGKPGRAELISALDRSDELLTQAEACLHQLHEQPGESPDRWRRNSAQRLETLQAFASAFRAYLLPGEGKEGIRQARSAASRLAPLLEDPNPSVSAAARLWQAALRARNGDSRRVLSALEPALLDPSPGSMRYAFFARLLRCRLLAESGGGFPTALALLMQMEERCEDWLAEDRERQDAIRAIRLVRVQLMADWYRKLSAADHVLERRWCVEHIEGLKQQEFGDQGDTVLRLSTAMPIVARIGQ